MATSPLVFAMSFPAWTRCAHPDCGLAVEWEEAFVIDTPDVIAVLHKSCAGEA